MPTNTPIPNHASLDFLGSQEWNTLTKLNNAIPMLGTTGALLGAPPAATAPNFYPQGGSTAGTTTAGGILTISFPVTFPGGVLTIVTTNGDNVAFGNLHFDVVSSTVTGTGVQVVAWSGAATANNAQVRCNWIALGW